MVPGARRKHCMRSLASQNPQPTTNQAKGSPTSVGCGEYRSPDYRTLF